MMSKSKITAHHESEKSENDLSTSVIDRATFTQRLAEERNILPVKLSEGQTNEAISLFVM